MDFDFTVREFYIKYFGYMDIISKIGGINGFVMPMIAGFAPVIALAYLYDLS